MSSGPLAAEPGHASPLPWQSTPAVTAMASAGLVAIVLGLLTRRPDVAVIGVPLLISVTWNWVRHPNRTELAQLTAADRLERPGRVSAYLDLPAHSQAESVLVRAYAPGHRRVEAVLATRASGRRVTLSMSTIRTGRRPLFDVDYREAGPDHLMRTGGVTIGPVRVTILPGVVTLQSLPLPFRLQGMTGPHSWRRTGDGGDLHDVNLFTPGDRLRRIDWRVTARRAGQGQGATPGRLSQLYVRRTFATADATVMLVLDSRDAVGPDVSTWGDATAVREDEPTSLDLARQAAASLAQRYLDGGDRVGMEDLGRMRRPVPAAGGRSQFHRLVHRLALSEPEGEPTPRQRVPRLPAGALIIVFSTFLDGDAARFAQIWRRAGHRVLAVDVLPRLSLRSLTPRLTTAYRLVAMERGDRIRALDRGGVETVVWDAAGGFDPTAAGSSDSAASAPIVALASLARKRQRR